MRKLLIAVSCIAAACCAVSAQTMPVLVDKVGRLVGPIWPGMNVLVTIGGQTVAVKYDEQGFDQSVIFVLHYEQPSCAGDAYMFAGTIPAQAFRRDADTILSPGPVKSTRQILSTKVFGQMPGMPPPADPCSPANIPLNVAPVVETPVAQFGFVAPFTAQLR